MIDVAMRDVSASFLRTAERLARISCRSAGTAEGAMTVDRAWRGKLSVPGHGGGRDDN
jgi:hypothetical protein